jgi:hypothetical protein
MKPLPHGRGSVGVVYMLSPARQQAGFGVTNAAA